MHVPWAPQIMSVIILTAVLSCLNSAFYVSSRVLFILADRGDAPQALVKLNARRVPVASVLMGAVAGFLGIIAATEARQVVFDFLVSSSGALIVFVYMIICFAQINLRRRRERDGLPVPPVTMWLFPYLSYAAIAGMAAVLVAMAFTPHLQRDFYVSCVTLAVAIAAFFIVQRLRQPRVAPSTPPSSTFPNELLILRYFHEGGRPATMNAAISQVKSLSLGGKKRTPPDLCNLAGCS